jgi:hypothetical protein
MAKPYQYVFVGTKAKKVGLPGGQLGRRHSSFTFTKKEFSHHAGHTGAFGQLGGYTQVLKLPVFEVRGLLDSLQYFSGSSLAKLGLLQEPIKYNHQQKKKDKRDKHEVSIKPLAKVVYFIKRERESSKINPGPVFPSSRQPQPL